MKKIVTLLAAVLLTTGLQAQQVVIVNTAAELSNAFLTAASGSEIRLTSDIAMDSTLWLGTELMGDSSSEGSRSLILNLFGHTLSRTDGSKRLIDLTHGDLTITSTFEGGQILDLASGSSIEDLILVTGSTLKDVNPMSATSGFYSCLTVSAGVTITAVKNAITIDRVGAATGHNIQYGTDVYTIGGSAQQYRSVANGVRLQVCGEIHAQKYCVKPNGILAAPTTDGTTLRTRNTNSQYSNYTVDAEDVDYVPYIYICSSAVLTTSATTTGSTALYASGYANWYINGASCSGNIGLYIKSGDLRVEGAMISSTNTEYYPASSPYASGVSAGGSAVVIESSLSGNGPVSLSIGGGTTISAESGYAIEELVTEDSTTNVIDLGIADCTLYGGYAGTILLSTATSDPSIFLFDEETVTMVEKQTESDCLDNISWQISEDSTLYVTGDGAICDYTVDVDGVRAPWAVYGPDVMRLELSEGITHIGDIAFLDFGNLVAVTCHALTPPTLGNYVFTFTEQTSSCPLYVPAESVLTYQSDSAWSSYFSNVQAIISTDAGDATSVQSIAAATGDSIRWIGTAETLTADKTLASLTIMEDEAQTLTVASGVKLILGRCILGTDAQIIVNPGAVLVINESLFASVESNIVLKSDVNETAKFVLGADVVSNRQPKATVEYTPIVGNNGLFATPLATTNRPTNNASDLTLNYTTGSTLMTTAFVWDVTTEQWMSMTAWSEILPFNGARLYDNLMPGGDVDQVRYIFSGNVLGNTTNALSWQSTGWNPLGNSFTAPMSTVALLNDLAGQDAEATVWFMDENDGSYKAVNQAMSVFTVPEERFSIPAMTGFLLKNTGTGEGTINIDYATTVYNYALNPTDAQYSLLPNPDNSIIAKAKITVSCSSEQDEVYLLEGSAYSSQYESGADISKIMNSGMNLYAVSGNDNLYMVCTNDLSSMPLTFKSNSSEVNYTMTFNDVDGTLYLYDAATGADTMLINGGTYDFTCLTDIIISDRFYIIQQGSGEPQICYDYGKLSLTDADGTTVRVLNEDGTPTSIADVTISFTKQEIDLSGLSSGRYKVEWNDQTLLIDLGYFVESGFSYNVGDECYPSNSSFSEDIVLGESYLFGCQILTPTSVGNHNYTNTLTNYCGEDSVITLTLTVYEATSALSGTCGDSLMWEFNPEDSTLTISGSGAMTNYSYLESAPWYTYKADLVHAILPDGLTTIGDQAFKSCSALISVTIPSSVTSIGNEAFYGCTGLETITCEAVTPPMWGDDAFAEVPNTIPVYVPAASVTTYQTSYTGWNLFTNIQAIPCSTPYEFSETYNLCGTDSFTWHGNVYTESGIYIDTLQSIEGCDSIITLELNLLPTYSFAEDTTIYEGDTCMWRERTLTEAGTYYDSLTSVFGCDSVYQLTLTLEPVPLPCEVEYHSTDSIVTCDGMPVMWHGRMYMNAGVYVDTVQSIFGCDSICTLQLTVNPNYSFLDEREICEGDTLQWRGRNLTKSGTYTDSLVTISGCDSIFTLRLKVNPKYLIEDIVSVREDKLPYMWQGEAITQSGDYRKEYTSSTGCDSVHTLHFTVTALPIYTVNVVADHGRVNGTGTYPEGTRIYLTAVPDEGFEFQMWSDGGETNPKEFVVTQDTTLRALFYMPEVEQEVTVDSIETNSVTITWDTVPGATLYELRIYKNGELVVTLQIDKDNNIIDATFAGPERIIARKDSTGGSSETLQVNVGGLEPGQDYTYSLDAMDDDRSYVGAQSGSFTTEEEPIDRLDTLFDDRRTAPRKILRDGRLYIEMPDGTQYDARGQISIDN